MKIKITITIIVLVLLLGAGFGFWGYIKAQEVKKQGKAIEQITNGTMGLKEISSGDFEIPLGDWKKVSDSMRLVENKLVSFNAIPLSLQKKINDFYSSEAEVKYKEAQFLQTLIDGQRKMDLKNTQPKSKGQMETVLSEFDKMQKSLDQNPLASGAEIDAALTKFHLEAPLFQKSVMDLANQMNFSSPAVQLSSASLDKAIDELKQALMKSLNDHVQLQNEIKKEISDLANINWVVPF